MEWRRTPVLLMKVADVDRWRHAPVEVVLTGIGREHTTGKRAHQ